MSQTRAITWSYGGGTQSVAIAVLIAQGKLPKPERIVIADTGREATETWEYLENHVSPLLAKVGAVVEIAPHSLSAVDLYSTNGDLLIPAYTANGRLPTFCSTEWKLRVVRRWLRAHKYGPDRPVVTWIGISLDEIGRAKPSGAIWQEYQWPLLMDVTMNRRECRQLVLEAGLPEPPKSSCWECPHRKDRQWLRLKNYYPADFEAACCLDEYIRYNDILGGGSGLWLHESRKPLREVQLIEDEPIIHPLFGQVEGCDSGLCWT